MRTSPVEARPPVGLDELGLERRDRVDAPAAAGPGRADGAQRRQRPVRERDQADRVAVLAGDGREHHRGVHRPVDLAEAVAARAVHQPPGLEREQERLAPLRLVHHDDRLAPPRRRLPRDPAVLVAADVLAQALELARRRLAAHGALAVRPPPRRAGGPPRAAGSHRARSPPRPPSRDGCGRGRRGRAARARAPRAAPRRTGPRRWGTAVVSSTRSSPASRRDVGAHRVERDAVRGVHRRRSRDAPPRRRFGSAPAPGSRRPIESGGGGSRSSAIAPGSAASQSAITIPAASAFAATNAITAAVAPAAAATSVTRPAAAKRPRPRRVITAAPARPQARSRSRRRGRARRARRRRESTMRWRSTAGASDCRSSGVTNSRPTGGGHHLGGQHEADRPARAGARRSRPATRAATPPDRRRSASTSSCTATAAASSCIRRASAAETIGSTAPRARSSSRGRKPAW